MTVAFHCKAPYKSSGWGWWPTRCDHLGQEQADTNISESCAGFERSKDAFRLRGSGSFQSADGGSQTSKEGSKASTQTTTKGTQIGKSTIYKYWSLMGSKSRYLLFTARIQKRTENCLWTKSISRTTSSTILITPVALFVFAKHPGQLVVHHALPALKLHPAYANNEYIIRQKIILIVCHLWIV